MNQGLKFKYTQMQEGDPTKEAPKNEYYATEGYVRNIIFVDLNGNETFLNYGNLVRGNYLIEEGAIVLTFTSDLITLKGINLKILFREFARNLPMLVVCQDARYNAVGEKDRPIINTMEITVTGNK